MHNLDDTDYERGHMKRRPLKSVAITLISTVSLNAITVSAVHLLRCFCVHVINAYTTHDTAARCKLKNTLREIHRHTYYVLKYVCFFSKINSTLITSGTVGR